MCTQNLVKFCKLILKILSKNKILTSIKGFNFVANLQNVTCNNPKLDNVNINVYTKFGQILFIHLFILKILSKNQILTLIKGRNSATNLRNTAPYILNLGLVNDNDNDNDNIFIDNEGLRPIT